jgi:hypothetical protein
MHGGVSTSPATRTGAARRLALLLLPAIVLAGPWLGRLELLVHDHGPDGRHVHGVPEGLAHGAPASPGDWHDGHHAPPPEDSSDGHRDGPASPGVVVCLSAPASWLGGSKLTERHVPRAPAVPTPLPPGALRILPGDLTLPPPSEPRPAWSRTLVERLLLSSHALLI